MISQLYSTTFLTSANALSEPTLILNRWLLPLAENLLHTHHISLSFTSLVTNLIHPILTHTIYSFSNFIYLLSCTQCKVFCMGETKNISSARMMFTDSLSLLVTIHTKSPNSLLILEYMCASEPIHIP
jgi:hypothetical protein